MQTGKDCLDCFMVQAEKTLQLSTDDENLQRTTLEEIKSMLDDFPRQLAPPENSVNFYRYIAAKTGTPDPYAAIKRESNDLAIALLPEIRTVIARAEDPFLATIRFAIGGNVLDNGAQQQLDIKETLAQCQGQELTINHYPQLVEKLSTPCRVLYLTDNCGEVVLDKVLIEQLIERGHQVTVAVRGGAAINDATLKDARYCGIDQLCTVISNGADLPGTSLQLCSEELRQYFRSADCIISKGMGNYECLSEESAPIFFLLTVKCTSVCDDLTAKFPDHNIEIGSAVVVSVAEIPAR